MSLLPDPDDLLRLCHGLGYYLKVNVELGTHQSAITQRGREFEGVIVRVNAINSAPECPEGPRVVFVGVRLVMALLQGGGSPQGRSRELKVERHGPEQPPGRIAKAAIHSISLGQQMDEITSHERQFGEVLFPGQSLVYELTMPSGEVPYVEFGVEGTVSRRHLFHHRKMVPMPEPLTKPLLISALRSFNSVDLHGPLFRTIRSLEELPDDPRLSDLQVIQSSVSENIAEVTTAREAVRTAETPNPLMRNHMMAAYDHLSKIPKSFGDLKEAISPQDLESITVAKRNIQGLSSDAAAY